MPNTISEVMPLEFTAGVMPETEQTDLANYNLYTAASRIRFENGKPKKVGGCLKVTFTDSAFQTATIDGKSRSIFSTRFANNIRTIIGTHKKLYDLYGTTLTNITPLQTSTTAIANSLATHYATLANNPIATTNGSTTITVTDPEASRFKVNDNYTLSGSAAVNGVPAGEINATHVVRSIPSATTLTIRVATAATSTGSGGGAAVVRTSGLITATAAAHGQSDGDRVLLAGAADTGGILAAQINVEHIIRNSAAGTFDVMTAGTATSSVAAGGGAGTTYQKQITNGNADESSGIGYGMGLYGAGLYGVPKVSASGRILPRIWFFDRFGDKLVMTPGEQTGVYSWAGSTVTAPALVSGAPTAVNYAFVSDNILVTFGASGTPNKIKTSDQGALTTWSASSTNQVFEDDIEGADRLLSHAPLDGMNLIFTETQTYTFRYIKLPLIWEIRQLSNSIGIIAPMARVVVNGIPYWMGRDNFYMWAGGNIEPIPSNVSSFSTIKTHVFSNFNYAQKSKFFAWHNKLFNEIWFHYCTAGSNEPDAIARYHVLERTWVPDTWDRIAAEYPVNNFQNPLLINSSSELFKHEVGVNENGAAMPWSLTGPLMDAGRENALISRILPDSMQDGNITLGLNTYKFPNSTTARQTKSYTVTDTQEQIAALAQGRYLKYTFSGNAVDNNWQMGNWQQEVQAQGRP